MATVGVRGSSVVYEKLRVRLPVLVILNSPGLSAVGVDRVRAIENPRCERSEERKCGQAKTKREEAYCRWIFCTNDVFDRRKVSALSLRSASS